MHSGNVSSPGVAYLVGIPVAGKRNFQARAGVWESEIDPWQRMRTL
jgi:hypothetical protein